MLQTQKHDYPAWLLFILAMGVWSFAIAGHELLGHGGVCAIDTGCDWRYADAMYFDGTRQEGFMLHLLRAAGSLFNILVATIAVFILWRKNNLDHIIRLILWMTLTINLFQSGSYIAFGWLIHPGMDWAKLSSLLPQPMGHIAVTLFGGIIITAGFVLSRYFYPAAADLKTKLKMLAIPLIACSVVAITASIFIPTDNRIMMIQGGIGGSIGFLFWMLILAFLPMPLFKSRLQVDVLESISNNAEPANSSSVELLILGSLLITALYLVVLTPGIHFS